MNPVRFRVETDKSISSVCFFPGGHGGVATPVPIPNTEVKGSSGEGTAGIARGRVARCQDFFSGEDVIGYPPLFLFETNPRQRLSGWNTNPEATFELFARIRYDRAIGKYGYSRHFCRLDCSLFPILFLFGVCAICPGIESSGVHAVAAGIFVHGAFGFADSAVCLAGSGAGMAAFAVVGLWVYFVLHFSERSDVFLAKACRFLAFVAAFGVQSADVCDILYLCFRSSLHAFAVVWRCACDGIDGFVVRGGASHSADCVDLAVFGLCGVLCFRLLHSNDLCGGEAGLFRCFALFVFLLCHHLHDWRFAFACVYAAIGAAFHGTHVEAVCCAVCICLAFRDVCPVFVFCPVRFGVRQHCPEYAWAHLGCSRVVYRSERTHGFGRARYDPSDALSDCGCHSADFRDGAVHDWRF